MDSEKVKADVLAFVDAEFEDVNRYVEATIVGVPLLMADAAEAIHMFKNMATMVEMLGLFATDSDVDVSKAITVLTEAETEIEEHIQVFTAYLKNPVPVEQLPRGEIDPTLEPWIQHDLLLQKQDTPVIATRFHANLPSLEEIHCACNATPESSQTQTGMQTGVGMMGGVAAAVPAGVTLLKLWKASEYFLGLSEKSKTDEFAGVTNNFASATDAYTSVSGFLRFAFSKFANSFGFGDAIAAVGTVAMLMLKYMARSGVSAWASFYITTVNVTPGADDLRTLMKNGLETKRAKEIYEEFKQRVLQSVQTASDRGQLPVYLYDFSETLWKKQGQNVADAYVSEIKLAGITAILENRKEYEFMLNGTNRSTIMTTLIASLGTTSKLAGILNKAVGDAFVQEADKEAAAGTMVLRRLLRNETFIKNELYLSTLIDTFDTGDEGQEAREEDIRQKFVIGVFFTTVVAVMWSINTAKTKRTRKIMELRAEYIGWKTPNGLKQDVCYLQRALAYNSKLAYFVAQYQAQDGQPPAKVAKLNARIPIDRLEDVPAQQQNRVDGFFAEAWRSTEESLNFIQGQIQDKERYGTGSGFDYKTLQSHLDNTNYESRRLAKALEFVEQAIRQNAVTLQLAGYNQSTSINVLTNSADIVIRSRLPLTGYFDDPPEDNAFMKVHGALIGNGPFGNLPQPIKDAVDASFQAFAPGPVRRARSPAPNRPVAVNACDYPRLSLASVTIRTLPRPRSVVDEVFAKHKDGGL